MIYLTLVFIVIVVVSMSFIYLVRKNSADDREHMTEEDRRMKVAAYLAAGLVIPLPVCFILYSWAAASTRLLQDRQWVLLIAGTLASMTGLPFIIRMLRLIRSDSDAMMSAFFLGPYGFLLWFVVMIFLSMLFMHGCC